VDLDVLVTPAELHDSIHAEWCRLQECLAWFEEEVELTSEEMCRVLMFFEWKWELSAASCCEQDSIDEQTRVGIEAYTHGQAEVYHQMITVFISNLYTLLNLNNLASSWLSQYTCKPRVKYCYLVSNVALYHPKALTTTDGDGTDPGDIMLGEGGLDFLHSLGDDDIYSLNNICSLNNYDTNGV
jgi:hypothetical protein